METSIKRSLVLQSVGCDLWRESLSLCRPGSQGQQNVGGPGKCPARLAGAGWAASPSARYRVAAPACPQASGWADSAGSGWGQLPAAHHLPLRQRARQRFGRTGRGDRLCPGLVAQETSHHSAAWPHCHLPGGSHLGARGPTSEQAATVVSENPPSPRISKEKQKRGVSIRNVHGGPL